MNEILDKMQTADVIVMASPVYFHSINTHMKAVIDRSLITMVALMAQGLTDTSFQHHQMNAKGNLDES